MDRLTITLLGIFIFAVAMGVLLYGKTKSGGKIPAGTGLLDVKGDYLGMEKPDALPQVFAPGILSSKDFEFSITFSPDGKEIFFSRRKGKSNNTVMYMKQVEGGWTTPAAAPFSKAGCSEFEPSISPDGQKLYYTSTRSGKFAIWAVEKTAAGWGEPRDLGSPINDGFAMYISVVQDGSLYLTAEGGINKATYKDGGFEKPEKLGPEINYLKAAHPFIAPDESYLVFDAKDEKDGKSRLYVSFRSDGSGWTKARELGGAVNRSGNEICPQVSPDGRYLFFHRDGDIYWVDSCVIHDLKGK